ncbi:MAG: hypothetical protein Q8P88_01420 [Candidatus Jorgensenbacteria bacterium]|nr:hypothetical protein [Candidatus Jorgensenbacteria bacterium]
MIFWSALSSFQGCYVASKEFLLYGYCESATFRVHNSVPRTIAIRVGGDPKTYQIAPGGDLIIPGRYPVFSNVYSRIPITASVEPFDPLVRDGGTTWHFSNHGHYLGGYGYSGGYTQGQEVHATVELSNPDPKAKNNTLHFRVQQ